MGNNPKKAQSGIFKFFLWLPAPRMGKEVVGSYAQLFSMEGSQGRQQEGKKRVPPKRKSVKEVQGICIPHSNQDTGLLLLSFATPAAYDGKASEPTGVFPSPLLDLPTPQDFPGGTEAVE